MNDTEQLEQLIESHHPCILINTYEEVFARERIVEATVNMQLDLKIWTITEGVREGQIKDGHRLEGTEHPAAAMLYMAHQEGKQVFMMLDLAQHLSDARTMRVLRDLLYTFERNNSTLILVDSSDEFPKPIDNYLTRYTLSLPDEEELETIVMNRLRNMNKQKPLMVNLTRGDLRVIVRNLKGLTRRQAEQIIVDTVSGDRKFDKEDVNRVMALKRQMLHTDGLLEYVQTPAELDEVGGLDNLKRWLEIRQNSMSDEAKRFGIEMPRGVLMLGIQGAGKSLCAKAIATAWQRPLLRLDPGSLYDRYIGESERRLRMALRQAEMMAPLVLWVDEIEKAFASAASRSTDGGLSQRMFGAMLTWMQEHNQPVFLVATANDIEALPPELLRKGRFDEIFFVDLPEANVRRDIFEIHLRKRKRDPKQFDLEALGQASEGFSGAEIEQAIIASMHDAFAEDMDLDTDLILKTVKNSPPLSVTMAERLNELRQWAKSRCVPAG